jgi:hypothetical protein
MNEEKYLCKYRNICGTSDCKGKSKPRTMEELRVDGSSLYLESCCGKRSRAEREVYINTEIILPKELFEW